MITNVQAQTIDVFGQSVGAAVDAPNECPVCHTTIEPVVLNSYMLVGATSSSTPHRLDLVLRCTSKTCLQVFVASYEGTQDAQLRDGAAYWRPPSVYPLKFRRREFDARISGLSPNFVVMYNQALEAEARGLDNICGVGFRRSLEFLIKDYVKKGSRKEDADAIERSPLGACIGQYVSDPVKSVAKRAAWLGNDETHYVRKWEDKDLKDLKTLIDLTVTWITSELLTDELVASMPEQAKPAP